MIDFDDLVVGAIVDVFGDPDQPILYRPPGQQPFPIDGVFDARAKEVKAFDHDGVAITDQRPMLFVQQSVFDAAGIDPQQGDKITIKSVDYQVADVNADSFGGIVLKLNQLITPA